MGQIAALHETHEQAQRMRNELKLKYGSDWDRLETVVKELDRLSHELHVSGLVSNLPEAYSCRNRCSASTR